MFDLKTQYNKLNGLDKLLFKEKLIEQLGISEYTFYNWYVRNYVPRKYQDEYLNFIRKPITAELILSTE